LTQFSVYFLHHLHVARLWMVTLAGVLVISACSTLIVTTTPAVPTLDLSNAYFISPNGSDTNPGTQAQPWQTIQKAVTTVVAGDTIYLHGGQYDGVNAGWYFSNSGRAEAPITFTNYPDEQVVIKTRQGLLDGDNSRAFRCWADPTGQYQTPKADYIKIIGTDVIQSRTFDSTTSKKGIVIQGYYGSQGIGIYTVGCSYWEVSGVDFIDTAGGIYNKKTNDKNGNIYSSDNWYVHNDRVYGFYRESGMQFNTDHNRVINNEIYKVVQQVGSPYGCQMIDLVGHDNIVSGNILSKRGSPTKCLGLLFEWDLSDDNIVEKNTVVDNDGGISIQGGDGNIIRNNLVYVTDRYHNSSVASSGGIVVGSYDISTWVNSDGTTPKWPCNEQIDPTARIFLPADKPSDLEYKYYYDPRNCHSMDNQIYNNDILGYYQAVKLYPLIGEGTIIRNNVFLEWTRGSICYYNDANGTCKSLSADLIADHNAANAGNFAFVGIQHFDFHLAPNSPLIDAGYDLRPLNPDDFDGHPRPQGPGYDIGAFEYKSK
jgi:parallel beta-helix repeat protein